MATSNKCPRCGAPEVSAATPLTVYACGASDYDQRPGTLEGKCERYCMHCLQRGGARKRELRPYGPGGRDVCAGCVFDGPPERMAEETSAAPEPQSDDLRQRKNCAGCGRDANTIQAWQWPDAGQMRRYCSKECWGRAGEPGDHPRPPICWRCGTDGPAVCTHVAEAPEPLPPEATHHGQLPTNARERLVARVAYRRGAHDGIAAETTLRDTGDVSLHEALVSATPYEEAGGEATDPQPPAAERRIQTSPFPQVAQASAAEPTPPDAVDDSPEALAPYALRTLLKLKRGSDAWGRSVEAVLGLLVDGLERKGKR